MEEDIIPDVNLSELWHNISDINKNNIWKYLQTFCIININLNSSKELQELLSGESNEIDKENKKDIKDLKKIKKLKNSIDGITKDNKELDEQPDMPEMNQMNNIFESTSIGKLAKEIAEGMDLESMMGATNDGEEPNLENVMQNIMNPNNFMNLFQNINSKVQEKMQTGELSEESLTGEAQNLYGDFADNPMFKNMMNNPELQKMQEQMGNQSNDEQQNNKEVVNNLENDNPKIVPKNKTQARLQKKLKEKKIKVSEVKKSEKVGKVNVNKEK